MLLWTFDCFNKDRYMEHSATSSLGDDGAFLPYLQPQHVTDRHSTAPLRLRTKTQVTSLSSSQINTTG